MSLKRGHSKCEKRETKKDQYRLRLDDEYRQKLDYLSEQFGMSRADILRRGVTLQWNMACFNRQNR